VDLALIDQLESDFVCGSGGNSFALIAPSLEGFVEQAEGNEKSKNSERLLYAWTANLFGKEAA
jgi:hypothetical protein